MTSPVAITNHAHLAVPDLDVAIASNPFVVETLSDIPLTFERPESLAETLFIAASVLRIGEERALQRVVHDVELLTEKTMKVLEDQGYELQIGDEILFHGTAKKEKPPIYNFVKEYEDGRIGRVSLLPCGKSIWGVSIIATSEAGSEDLTAAVETSVQNLVCAVQRASLQLQLTDGPVVNTMDHAVMNSTRNYEIALGFARFDPLSIKDMLERYLAPAAHISTEMGAA